MPHRSLINTSKKLDCGDQAVGRGAAGIARGAARCASKVLDPDAQTDARGAAQVFDCGAQAVARGAARCASQALDRCVRPLPAAPLVVRRRYLILVPRPLPAAVLVVHHQDVFIYRGAQAAARGGARCASEVLDRCARPLHLAPRR